MSETKAEESKSTLREFPAGTVVWRTFKDAKGKEYRHRPVFYHLKSPYWRVKYGDEDWEQLSRQEVHSGKKSLGKTDSEQSETNKQKNLLYLDYAASSFGIDRERDHIVGNVDRGIWTT